MKQHILNSFVSLCDGESFSYVEAELKDQMHCNGRAVLKEFVEFLGLQKESYAIRSNYGGIAGSGEITLHAETFYMQINPGSALKNMEIMIRSCKGMNDYTGGTNNFCSIKDLRNPLLVTDLIFQVARNLKPVRALQMELIA